MFSMISNTDLEEEFFEQLFPSCSLIESDCTNGMPFFPKPRSFKFDLTSMATQEHEMLAKIRTFTREFKASPTLMNLAEETAMLKPVLDLEIRFHSSVDMVEW